MNLSELKPGQSAKVKAIGVKGELYRHFLDMGIVPSAEITLVKYAPGGDPAEIKIHDGFIAIRLKDAQQIEIQCGNEKSDIHTKRIDFQFKKNDKSKTELSENEPLSFALIGNQNCGKTTLFNALTGSNQHVGNFPGVTVEQKSGVIKGYKNVEIVDLPGIYSLSPFTKEEVVSRNFLLKSNPTGIINIVDATNLSRSLYLTLQAMQLGIPMVLALNMMDEVKKNHAKIDAKKLENMLGIPVIPISASKNKGIDELINTAVNVARKQIMPNCLKYRDNSIMSDTLNSISDIIAEKAKDNNIPLAFASSKVFEGDNGIIDMLSLSEDEKGFCELTIKKTEEELSQDRSGASAFMKYSVINEIVKSVMIKPKVNKEAIKSQKIDKILTGKFTALPSFIVIIGIIFALTFSLIGPYLQNLMQKAVDFLSDKTDMLMQSANVNDTIRSLITDGIFTGVGSVLSFLPIIVTLFMFLSLLEDTGYMARVTFIADKMMRKVGLSGKSTVPMLIGFGCSVPAIMSSRTLQSKREQKMTVTLIPYMSCTAKLPIYTYFAAVFFPEHKALVMILLYFAGILSGIITAFILNNSIYKGKEMPFIIELPNYRMPSAKTTLRLMYDKAKDFVTKAFTVIFSASIVIWFTENFSFTLKKVSSPQDSMLRYIAGAISHIFTPLGFGDWRLTTSLITGFIAKESVISTISVLFTDTESLIATMSNASVISFLIFCLLYTPCIAAINTIKREFGTKQAIKTVLFQCTAAWIEAGIVYGIARLIF